MFTGPFVLKMCAAFRKIANKFMAFLYDVDATATGLSFFPTFIVTFIQQNHQKIKKFPPKKKRN